MSTVVIDNLGTGVNYVHAFHLEVLNMDENVIVLDDSYILCQNKLFVNVYYGG